MLKAVFFGGLLSRHINNQGFVNSILCATEICKRILEIYRLDLTFPKEQEFYMVSFKKGASKNQIIEKQKEDNFVLDCININKSKLGVYNPLKDNNLYSFFSSHVIRKHLKHVGFINTKGFILNDPSKQTGNSPIKDKSNYDSELQNEKKMLIAIQESEKCKSTIRKSLINRSKYLHDVGVMELEKLVKTCDYTPSTHAQLPSFDSKHKLKPIKGYSSILSNKSIMDRVTLYIIIIYLF